MKIDAKIAWLDNGYKTKLFEDESLKQASIKPSNKDNFLLTPQDDPKTFVEFLVGGQSDEIQQRPKLAQRRIKSASAIRLKDRPWVHPTPPKYPAGFVQRSRPGSARPASGRPSSAAPSSVWSIRANAQRRIKSAGSVRSSGTQAENHSREVLDEIRKGFTLVNKLYENSYRTSMISLHPAGPAPDYRYFDRHSRCYDHNHAHKQLSRYMPQTACAKFLECCGSRAVSPARLNDPNTQPQRYIDYHRPHTAPTTRGELQYVPRASTYKGHTPHFCNFVHQMQLHSKALNGTDSTGIPYSELGDDLTFVGESTEGKLVNKYRKNSNASSDGSINRGLTKSPKLEDYEHDSIPETKEDHVVSGTEGRPGSPSSLDGESRHGDDDSQQQQPVTGIGKRKVQFGSRYFQGMIGDSKSISEEGDEDNKSGRDLDYNTWDNGQVIKGASSQGHTDLDTTLRPPSPRDPPPSPELSKKKEPKEIPLPTTAPKTKDCKKKTKKPVERVRTMKATDEPPVEVQPTATEETRPPEVVLTVSDNVDSKRDIQVPDLPDLETKETNRKEKGKPKRHLIETEDDLLKPDLNDILNEQLRLSRPEFDWSNMETTNGGEEVKRHPQIKSWIQGRLALSQQSSRFELPMDMKRLETMTPQEYIRKHCIITSRRQNLYQKIFMKNKDKSATILYKDLDRSLKDVLVNTITSEQVQDVLKSLEIDEQTRVDQKLFYGVAAYAERVLYPKFVTEDTHDMPEYQREKIECADFCALNWKIHGVNVPKNMLNVLKQIT
ncbi:uncharacterized protein LOC127861814 isoform X7 [Dreissena polymorpha]|uniref:uncharacterized protein LOC127861814 isoform X7 n=1 Tax=Dreissena polymorpha TaxID=45954 RepID=UPI002263FCF8|nr:uncharacterized protein LOC127861814 isoform X7 [Dreissena polymorpha]XP_052256533.1 uncharacterized protein LOC127861814 isoform X7 [Dreissena polymorpha]XP_052256538.1 uncharacterized protein LOC127861814 isoform X7 [Dreissena polymorpha]